MPDKNISHSLNIKDALRLAKKACSSKFAIMKDEGNSFTVGSIGMTAKIIVSEKNIVVSGSGLGGPIANTCSSAIEEAISDYADAKEEKNTNQSQNNNGSIYDEQIKITMLLKNYKDLLDAGIISKDEYEIKKASLLDKLEKNEAILNPNEIQKKQDYEKAIELEKNNKLNEAKELFKQNINYLDSKKHFEKCEQILKEQEYQKALNHFANKEFEDALVSLEDLIDYKDSESLINQCKQAIKTKQEKELKENTYNSALEYENIGRYEGAIGLYQTIIDYKDSKDRISICKKAFEKETKELNESKYQQALLYEKNGNYLSALGSFKQLDGYKDSSEHIEICKKSIEIKAKEDKYNSAQIKLADKPPIFKVNKAISILKTINDYKDSEFLIRKYNDYIDSFDKAQKKKKKIITISVVSAVATLVIGLSIGIPISAYVNKEKKKQEQYNRICDTIDVENFRLAYNMCKDYTGKNRDYLMNIANAGMFLSNNNYERAIEILCFCYVETFVAYDSNGGTAQKQTDYFNHDSNKTSGDVYVYNPCSLEGYSFVGWKVSNIQFESRNHKTSFTLIATWNN